MKKITTTILLALGLTAGLIVSTAPASQAHATPPGLVATLCATPVGGHYYMMPGYIARVDAKKSISGGFKVYSAWVNIVTRQTHAHINYCWH